MPACMASSLRFCSFVRWDIDTAVVVVVVVDGFPITVEDGVVTIELIFFTVLAVLLFSLVALGVVVVRNSLGLLTAQSN